MLEAGVMKHPKHAGKCKGNKVLIQLGKGLWKRFYFSLEPLHKIPQWGSLIQIEQALSTYPAQHILQILAKVLKALVKMHAELLEFTSEFINDLW
jgi:hypothetical protein